MAKIILYAIIMGLGFNSMAGEYKKLLLADFEDNKLNNNEIRQKTNLSAGVFKLVPEGQLSKFCLKAEKPDTCGSMEYKLSTSIPAESKGHWLLITADIKSGYVGSGAEYLMQVLQSANGKETGKNVFPYNDGISRESIFGGLYKSPQTLGKWKKTIHQIQLKPETDKVELVLLVKDGKQELFFDNIRIDDVGTKQLPAQAPLIYEKTIDWPYAMLDLDNLLPGAVYRIETEITWPSAAPEKSEGLTPNAAASKNKAPATATGMGIAMTAVGLNGVNSAPEQLPEIENSKDKCSYRLVVPEMAVKILLDLHNDDLIRFDHNQIEKQARRWKTVRVYLENYGEIAADNAYWQYVYRNKPEELKVRNYVDINSFDMEVLKETLRNRQKSELKLVRYNNAMCFLLDNKHIAPVLSSIEIAGNCNYKSYDNLAKNGINLVFARSPYGGMPVHGDWQDENKYDYTDMDMNIYKVLSQNPKANIILSIDQLYPPDWWSMKNPDELVRTQDGLFVWCPGMNLYKRNFGTMEQLKKERERQLKKGNLMHQSRGAKLPGHFLPTAASEKYRELMVNQLAAMRRHIEQQPYGNAVVGYRLLWGYDGQWGPLREAYDEGGKHCIDFSKPMLKKFQSFLLKKYKNNDALCKAWNDAGLTFDKAQIPGFELRHFDQMTAGRYLLDPKKEQAVIDYRECESEATGELLLAFCNAIKNTDKRSVLTIAYYPDILETASGGATGRRGQQIVYKSADFDAAGGPSYDAREIGQSGRSNCLLNSLTFHNKIHLNEIDHRVFPVVKRNYAGNQVFDTPFKSISMLQREYMRQMCFGTGSWTFDMGFGWYNDPLIASVIGNINKVFNQVIEYDRGSIAGMAIFIGEYGKIIQADAKRGAIPKKLVTTPIIASAQAGLPIDQYLINDLSLVADKYKVFFFPFAYGFSTEDMQAIEALKKNGNILVFGYGAGYVSDKVSIDNMEKLTGFKFGIDPKLELTVKVERGNDILTSGIAGNYFGAAANSSLEAGMPKFFVNDANAVSLGKFVNSDKVGFALKDNGSWKSIYIGSIGSMPPELLRNIGAFAGLHVYNNTGDVLYFNKSLIAIHASSDGIKKIKLPRPANVTSLWDNKKAGKLEVIERPMKIGENALYLIQE